MKKIFCILLGFLGLISCQDNLKVLDKGNEELVLTTTETELVLNETEYSQDAIALTWTSGSNYGTGKRISYKLLFAIDDAEPSYTIDLGNRVYEWKKTVEEFNNFLYKELGLAYGQDAKIKVRIVAEVLGHEEYTQISEQEIFVKTYEPVSSTLYILGDATKTGWSLDSMTEMIRVENGVFKTTISLKAEGVFKFMVTKDWLPCYSTDDEGKMFYKTSFDEPDNAWSVETEGFYDIVVDILRMTVSVTPSTGPRERFENTYIVGSFTNWGFIPMTHDPLAMNMWFYGGNIGAGEFKFGTVQTWSDMLFASYADAPYTSTDVVYQSSTDNKWRLKDEEVGAYKIYLNVTQGKEQMIMTPFEGFEAVYLVGDATSTGWSLGSAEAMTQDASDKFLYTWTGSLSTGQLKFSIDKQSDWFGGWFMSLTDQAAPTGEEENMIYLNKTESLYIELYPEISVKDIDRKWKIQDAGTYKITLNTLTHKVKIVKQ